VLHDLQLPTGRSRSREQTLTDCESMTDEEFRALALEVPTAVELSHMNHPDFRIGGKIFASLGVPDENSAMVKLMPEQQRKLMARAPRVFTPCSGAWGRQGCTNVHLPAAEKRLVQAALESATKTILARPKRKSS
jgi:hypothetical protein